MRLFVAIELDDTVRSAAVQLIERLRAQAPALKWVKPETLHLTMKFIGHVEEQRLEPIKEALRAVSTGSHAEIVFARLWWMPNPRRPSVFWAGVVENSVLAELARGIEDALQRLGIDRETRPFRPHLTLARYPKRKTPDARRLEQAAADVPADVLGGMEAREFALVESRLSPAGPKYTTLERFGFVRSA